jgi:hypothetical protein
MFHARLLSQLDPFVIRSLPRWQGMFTSGNSFFGLGGAGGAAATGATATGVFLTVLATGTFLVFVTVLVAI